MTFHINTTKHAKIWFSSDPNVFLEMEDQLRLIHTLYRNPQARFTFIYSSAFLFPYARKQLIEFCEKNKVTPLDFDTDILNMLDHPLDIELHKLAKLEIHHALQETGGNLASASDLLRLIVPVLEAAGIYADFDTAVDFSAMPTVMEVSAPVLIASEFYNNPMSRVTPNNEIIVAAFDPNDPTKLHPEAVARIRRIQQEIINRYRSPQLALFELPIKGMPIELYASPDLFYACQAFFIAFPNETIFNFRRFCQNMSFELYQKIFDKLSYHGQRIVFKRYSIAVSETDDEKTVLSINSMKNIYRDQLHNLYILAVTLLSGPSCYYGLYNDEADLEFAYTTSEESKILKWNSYIDSMKKGSLRANGLSLCLRSGNCERDEQDLNNLPKDKIYILGAINDLSWCPFGAKRKAARAEEQHRAATTIQYAWRNWVNLNRKPAPVAGSSSDPASELRTSFDSLSL